jgi:hypothetical protein
MSKIILPIDTKSLYLNILNDNLSGHTATVATPLKQGNSYNYELGRLLEIKEKEIYFQDKPDLIKELLKNSKSKILIKNVFVFDKISVNGIAIETKKQYCIFIKEEVDPSKAQFGRLKIHYPTNLKYEDIDLSINNKEIMQLISIVLKNYAFIVKSFEYDFKTQILNFNALIVGDNKVPYSKVFVNEKGVGNKFNLIFNEMAEDYDMEIISLRQHFGENVNTDNFYELALNNKIKSLDLIESTLKNIGAKNIEKTGLEYPYSLFDIRYEMNDRIKYAIVVNTSTNLKYFNLSIKRNIFCHSFEDCCDVFLITNILVKPTIHKYSIADLDNLDKSINSIKFTDGGE